ncbi:MAG: 3-deoxy-D-manno-octulosonic acid kinase [Gammaproteobacteria bacterium]|nr:3-deoxy-D-manno-octulosonic acid kinase [Gammaproteobacteria bacterium]
MSLNINKQHYQGELHYIISSSLSMSAPALKPEWFDTRFWQQQGEIQAATEGRGQAWHIKLGEKEFALRHYCRGGKLAGLLKDRYFGTNIERSRAYKELALLSWLYQKSLPVPAPVGARVKRSGLIYRADILTAWIAGAKPLTEWLGRDLVNKPLWESIGECIRRFHRLGVDHPDITAQNILIDEASKVYLIDFDRARQREVGSWQDQNMKRFWRSLNKWWSRNKGEVMPNKLWQKVLYGYDPKQVI